MSYDIGITESVQELEDAKVCLSAAGWAVKNEDIGTTGSRGVLQYRRPGLVVYHGWLDLYGWQPGDGRCVSLDAFMRHLLPNNYG